nr:MAG TPA: Protein of unknown function (DUF2644) [Caudoviricetes sp.]
MNKFCSWLAGAFTNHSTGRASHTKIWTHVAFASMTYKFLTATTPVEWMWWCFGCIVGGYALGKSGLSIIPQVAAIRKEEANDPDTDAAE